MSAPRDKLFYAFQINEYAYRWVKFSAHHNREAAERRATLKFVHEQSPVSADLSPMVLTYEQLLEWVKECSYEIDWKNKVLIYQDPQEKKKEPEMSEKVKLKTIELDVAAGAETVAEMQDPKFKNVHYIEAFLPATEIVKLPNGNANVRSASELRKPFKGMIRTAEQMPAMFQLMNRGIIYLCTDAEYDRHAKKIRVSVPEAVLSRKSGQEPFGPMDGGHTKAAMHQIVEEFENGAYNAIKDWSMPYGRVRFVVNKQGLPVAPIVEAVNTSLQVKEYTLDEYQGKFNPLKDALFKQGFDPDKVSWRENEDREWHVVEIVQRLACFLKERWVSMQPVAMYKSKTKALQLYANTESRREFTLLFDVIQDIITLPEYIQAQFSLGEVLKGRKLGKLEGVRKLKEPWTRPNTIWPTEHRIDIGVVLPMAAAFRHLLYIKRGQERYSWRVDYKKVFEMCADDLYEAFKTRVARIRAVAPVAADPDYWGNCATIVMNAKDEVLDKG